jgi:hypothetical protein
MHRFVIGLVGIAAATAVTTALATDANAQLPNAAGPLPSAVTPYLGDATEIVPKVTPGDQIAIACDALEQRGADSDVRVVLTISAMPGESAPGYQKVLATDEQLLKDAVRVRIPTVPELEDHTVDLNVYVVSDKGAYHCDGGHMKIS